MALIGTLSVVQKSFRIRGWEAVGIVNVQAGRPRGGACGGALAVQQLVQGSARLSLCTHRATPSGPPGRPLLRVAGVNPAAELSRRVTGGGRCGPRMRRWSAGAFHGSRAPRGGRPAPPGPEPPRPGPPDGRKARPSGIRALESNCTAPDRQAPPKPSRRAIPSRTLPASEQCAPLVAGQTDWLSPASDSARWATWLQPPWLSAGVS